MTHAKPKTFLDETRQLEDLAFAELTGSDEIMYEALHTVRQIIRVLEVAPGTGHEEVKCALKTVSLLDSPPPVYETISYCCGLAGATSTIRLNGSLIEVTASSDAALRRMRLANTPRTLWIDAICINQQCKTERSEQVALMGTIYKMGRCNLVYLGEVDDRTAKSAIQAMGQVVEDMHVTTVDFTLVAETLRNPPHIGVALWSDVGFTEGLTGVHSWYSFLRRGSRRLFP